MPLLTQERSILVTFATSSYLEKKRIQNIYGPSHIKNGRGLKNKKLPRKEELKSQRVKIINDKINHLFLLDLNYKI